MANTGCLSLPVGTPSYQGQHPVAGMRGSGVNSEEFCKGGD